MESEKTVHAFDTGNCKTNIDYATSQQMAVYVMANTLTSICKMPGTVVRVHKYSNTWNSIDLKHFTCHNRSITIYIVLVISRYYQLIINGNFA